MARHSTCLYGPLLALLTIDTILTREELFSQPSSGVRTTQQQHVENMTLQHTRHERLEDRTNRNHDEHTHSSKSRRHLLTHWSKDGSKMQRPSSVLSGDNRCPGSPPVRVSKRPGQEGPGIRTLALDEAIIWKVRSNSRSPPMSSAQETEASAPSAPSAAARRVQQRGLAALGASAVRLRERLGGARRLRGRWSKEAVRS